jgi:hypothetical protein
MIAWSLKRGFMERFGGRPYWDGIQWRCPDCNGFIALRANKEGVACLVCRRWTPIVPSRFGLSTAK